MGEVYAARDTRLDRPVAIKLLHAEFAERQDRRARFETEARAISSLNHPHICTLFDIGDQDGRAFLVMEFLEGETLDDRLTRGPLPMDEVLRYALEIAGALDHAHRQQIIHRDVKPSNVMLTASGAKLLDFGLAKGPSLTASSVATQTLSFEQRQLTAAGTILGTFQYMAPEQLEGHAADARTDVFSFGTLLYEMATGRKAFDGQSQASLIASILTGQPEPISSTQAVIDAASPVFRARSRRRSLPREESGRPVADDARRPAGARVDCRGPALNAGDWFGEAQDLTARSVGMGSRGRCDRRGLIVRVPSDAQCSRTGDTLRRASAPWHHDWHRREPHTHCHFTRWATPGHGGGP